MPAMLPDTGPIPVIPDAEPHPSWCDEHSWAVSAADESACRAHQAADLILALVVAKDPAFPVTAGAHDAVVDIVEAVAAALAEVRRAERRN